MVNIQQATEEELYKSLQEVNISEDTAERINTELLLRKDDISYQNCYYKHKNGNCAAIGGFCNSNCNGDTLCLCQRYRREYIDVTHKTS